MRPFKEGAFLLAKRTGSPVIPIVHTGSENTFPLGSGILLGRANIRIRVLDEIPASVVDELDVKALMALVREVMEKGLSQLESE
jgi:1-acyl-sn-glycerol-3-phosphate acyltransferase